MLYVYAPNPARDGLDQCTVNRISPCLEVLAVHPNDIRKGSVAISQILPVCECLRDSAFPQHTEPAARFYGIQEYDHAMCGCCFDHVIRATEISRVWR